MYHLLPWYKRYGKLPTSTFESKDMKLFCKFETDIPAQKIRRLGGQEWVNITFDTLLWCEPYFSEVVLQRTEQVVVRRDKVKAKITIRLDWHFDKKWRLQGQFSE